VAVSRREGGRVEEEVGGVGAVEERPEEERVWSEERWMRLSSLELLRASLGGRCFLGTRLLARS
jgi:hypothetical protein